MADRDRRIQEIAYLLWEQEGRPDGESDRFWHLAVEQYQAETGEVVVESEISAVTEIGAAQGESAEGPRKRGAAKPKATEAEAPASEAKAKSAKAKNEKPKAVKAKVDETPAVAPKAGVSEPAGKSAAKPKPAKKSWF